MKHVQSALSIVVAAMLAVALAACGSLESGGDQGFGKWTIETETDDFGDEVEGGHSYLAQAFTGEFSNTATVGSDCSGMFGVVWHRQLLQYTAQIMLFDYGNNPMTYTGYEDMTLKTKGSDGVVEEYKLEGTAPDGMLVCGNAGRLVFDLLDEPESMRCIVEVGSSRYEFALSCAGFAEAFAENRPDVLSMVEEDDANNPYPCGSVQRALELVMPGSGWEIRRSVAAKYLIAHAYDFERLSHDELESLVHGTYGNMQLNDGTDDYMSWDALDLYDVLICDYTPADWTCTRAINQDEGRATTRLESVSAGGSIAVDGDAIVQNGTFVYEVRRISDGYYLMRMTSGPSQSNGSVDLYVLMYACDAEGNPTGA
ncbi:MAG: hypothetical protein IJH08_01710 [Atopobiaceae bacterium]|nr:hypothetical protein [Atopobiaceae bacterium]